MYFLVGEGCCKLGKRMGSKLILKKDVLPNKKIEGKYYGSQLTDSAKKGNEKI